MTRKLATLAALAVVAAAPAAADAHKGSAKHNAKHKAHKTKVMRAKLSPVAADVAAYTNMRGKAQFVSNKKKAKVSIQLKGMVPGTVYPWAVVTGSCDGAPVEGFTYKKLKARPSGNASSKGKSKTFKREPGTKYYVVVYAAGTTEPLLCGKLKGKHSKHKKGKGKSKKG